MPPVEFEMLTAIPTAELVEVVMPWARANEPEKAAQVEARAADEKVHRRWLGRLLELRYHAEDAEGKLAIPLLALHETALVVKFRHRPTGAVLTVSGKHAPKPWTWTFAELASFTRAAVWREDDAGFTRLLLAKQALDLEHA